MFIISGFQLVSICIHKNEESERESESEKEREREIEREIERERI